MPIKGYDFVINSIIKLSFANPSFFKFDALINLILSLLFIIMITISLITSIQVVISILNFQFIFDPVTF